MKHNYEASRATLTSKPFHTQHSRILGFLLYPAKGRSIQQLSNDYQEVISKSSANLIVQEQIKSVYAINWARSEPDNALRWAHENIADLDTLPIKKDRFVKIWQLHDPTTARKWLRNHPEMNVSQKAPSTVIPTTLILALPHQKTTTTLPH